MRLGGSLARRRGGRKPKKAGSSKAAPAKKKRAPRAPGEGGGWGRFGGILLGLIAGGWLVGYVVSTQFVFPAPPPTGDMYEVPDLRGLGMASARERLADSDLALGAIDSLLHPSISQSLIVGQSPLPGQLAMPQTEVRITFSMGPQLRTVPDVTRLAEDRARIVLETSGFLVSTDTTESELPRGRVVESMPAADTLLPLPAEIVLMVSTGPPMVPMPFVLGLEEAEAVQLLDSLGLVVSEVAEVFRFGRDRGIVVEQEPAADTELERGTEVQLSIGRRGGQREP